MLIQPGELIESILHLTSPIYIIHFLIRIQDNQGESKSMEHSYLENKGNENKNIQYKKVFFFPFLDVC